MTILKTLVFIIFIGCSYGILIDRNDDHVLVENPEIITIEDGVNLPRKFQLKLDQSIEGLFEEIPNQKLPEVTVIENGHHKKVLDQSDHVFRVYSEKNGRGFATLFRNKRDSKSDYKVMARFSEDWNSEHYDLVHDSQSKHLLFKRKIDDNIEFNTDYIVPDEYKNLQKNDFNNRPRAVNNQPVVFTVEILAVVDPSVYNLFKTFLNTTNDDLIFENIRVYYAHVMNGVDSKYQNSLKNDPDLRINIKLVHIIIITNQADAKWTDIKIVGDSTYPTYNGVEVILKEKVLTEFKKFINSLNSSYVYDHAVVVFKKDIWTDNTTDTPEARSTVAGVAYLGGVCYKDIQFSINEENGGLQNIYVIAHEIGHNLGAYHDEIPQNNCPSSSNFIMSPSIGFDNFANSQLFSSCSIEYFKTRLLINYGEARPESQCLLTNDVIVPDYVEKANYTMAGQKYDLDFQCKTKFGNEALFCQINQLTLCQKLYCRKNLIDPLCYTAGPPVEGTTCDSGKICVQGSCIANENSLISVCPFGDYGVANGMYGINTGDALIKCQNYFSLLDKKSYSVQNFCNSEYGLTKCCSSCQKYKLFTCVDEIITCPGFLTYCPSGVFTSGNNAGRNVRDVCKVTCKTCNQPAISCNENVLELSESYVKLDYHHME
ncbi:unnamed protein product [Brachionus calyciflorus]|uniref:Peptidase M12B domain-containing protein n=1 Tax=Brachionus calyciflorus TaxID=104777 RepID=A0A814DHF1_9BILA|nr:unnamed protein product [Brachionus calyciflorus]